MTRCVLLFVGLSAWSAAVTGGEVKADREVMQGQWVIASFIFNGEERPRDTFKDLGLEIKGDKYLIKQGGETALRTFRLDPAKTPKAMDITYDDGPNKGKTNHAIYILEGDVLTICRHQLPEKDRPQEFTAKAGSGRSLIKWKRIK
jgi:RNA polymerase sigma-70 factor (ECF subfamily)